MFLNYYLALSPYPSLSTLLINPHRNIISPITQQTTAIQSQRHISHPTHKRTTRARKKIIAVILLILMLRRCMLLLRRHLRHRRRGRCSRVVDVPVYEREHACVDDACVLDV